MRIPQVLKTTFLGAALSCAGLVAASAQTASWIGASGGEWNTLANWDIGIPDAGTNAVIGSTITANYNLPMVSPGFGVLTNNGVLNINASGFNNSGVIMLNPGGTGKIFVNAGGALNVTGNLGFCSNSIVSMAAGSSVAVSGTLIIGSDVTGGSTGTGTVGEFGSVTNNGGSLTAAAVSLNPRNQSIATSCRLIITGGTNNLGAYSAQRSPGGNSAPPALGTDGLVISNGFVNTTSIAIGNNAHGVMFLVGGTATNTGAFTLKNSTATRPARFLQVGGLFVNSSANPVVMSPSGTTGDTVYSVLGGTNIISGIQFGALVTTITSVTNVDGNNVTNIVNTSNVTSTPGVVYFTNAATMYIGSAGISSNGTATVNALLNAGGKFVSATDWTNSAPITLNGGTFVAQDASGTPHNIYDLGILRGTGGLIKSGSGTLALAGTNSYSGATTVSAGTLALVVDPSGSIGSISNSASISVSSNATFDVSGLSGTGGFVLGGNQTLSGFGTVTGMVMAAASSTIYPGSNTLTGTLTFTNVLTETGGGNLKFNLSSNPSGPNNDFINAAGGLVLSGSNNVVISGALTSGSVYPLISYSGSLTGGITNLTLSGATGILSNSLTAQTIYLIIQSSVRGPTNMTWIGNATVNNWDTGITTNWINNGTGLADFFMLGDSVLFNNTGAINSQVNIAGNVTPASISINTTSNYTFTGSGAIGGIGSLAVSNGILNILTTNTYTGPTILAGGILSTPVLGNSLSPSGIGAASSDPANLVFNGGTFNYSGVSAGTDHGLTLTNNGGTIDVTNGTALTLNGAIVGNGRLTVVDSGKLILANANSYTNSTIIAGGNLQLNNAVGAGTGSIISSNGTLTFYPGGGISVANPFSFIAGTTNTIIVTSGSGGVNPTSTGNWSGGGTIVFSNSYNPFTMMGNMDAFTGTILMTPPNAAAFRFYSSTGSTNATFDLGINGNVISRDAGTINLGALLGGAGTVLAGPGSSAGTAVFTIGNNNLSTTFFGTISNGSFSSGTGISALTKVGTGTLTLSSGGITTNISSTDGFTYTTNYSYSSKLLFTGNTIISNGVLALVVPTALTNTPSVTLASVTAVLDASAMGIVSNQYDSDGVTVTNQMLVTNGVFEVISGQKLAGLGTIRGTLQADAGSTLSVGLPGSTGVLNVTNTISLNGATTMKISRVGSPVSDELVAQQSAISFGGTLTVTNIGGQLRAGDTFTLFSAAGSVYNNSFSSIVLPANATWDTTQLAVNGTIRVTSAAGPPVIGSANFSQLSSGSITLNASGNPNAAVSVLSSTNVALPLAQWTSVASGNFDSNGNYNPTISVNPAAPQQYFILQTQ